METFHSCRRLRPLLVFLFCAVLLSIGCIGLEITQMNVRFALMVEELSVHKPHLFATLNGVPYCDYFSPWLWCAWLTSLGGRAVNLFTLALPAILLGSYTVMMVWVIGEKIREGIGTAAAVLLLVTPEFVSLFTGTGIDVPIMAAGVTLLYLYQIKCRWWSFCGWFFLLLVLVFFLRGPLGVILLGAGICGLLLGQLEWMKFLTAGLTAGFAMASGVAGAWGLILLIGGRKLLDWVVESQFMERVSQGRTGVTVFWDAYFTVVPITLLSLGIFLHRRSKIIRPLSAGWIGFLLLPLLFLTLPSRVHIRYMAPLMPVWGLLAAYAWSFGKPFRLLRRLYDLAAPWLEKLTVPLGMAALLGMVVTGTCLYGFSLEQPWGHYLCAALLLATSRYWCSRELMPFRPLLMIGILLIIVLNPLISIRENSRAFVTTAEKLCRGKVWLVEMGPDHDDLKYLLHVAPDRRRNTGYLFFEPPELTGMYRVMYQTDVLGSTLDRITENDLLIVRDRDEELDELNGIAARRGRRSAVVCSGNIGHRKFLAVRLTGKDPSKVRTNSQPPSPQENR